MQREGSRSSKPLTESEKYMSFGLGKGVDGMQQHLLTRNGPKVRTVLHNLKNISEAAINDKNAYSDTIKTTSGYHAEIGSTLSADIALLCSIEGDFTRSETNELFVKGQYRVIVTHTL